MKARWQDWINLALGLWLFASPWLLYYTSSGAAAWQAYYLGGAVFVFALWALFDEKGWGQRFNAVIGTWLVVSAWVIGFSDNLTATINALIVGGTTAIVAVWRIMRPRTPPRGQVSQHHAHGHQ